MKDFKEALEKRITKVFNRMVNGVDIIGNGEYKKILIEDTMGNGVYSKFRLQAISVDTTRNIIEVIEEGRADDIPAGLKGGVITLSTDINATAGSGLIGKIKAWATTMLNRITSVRRIKNAVYSGGGGGMTIGRFFRGVYKSKNGKTFDENSMSVEVLYIDSPTLENIATDLAKEFNQETVLVKDYNTGEMYFADQKDITSTHVESIEAHTPIDEKDVVLDEAAKKSLSRVIHHLGRYDTGIITAFRGVTSPGTPQHINPKTGNQVPDAITRQLAANRKNNTTLKLAIRAAGFSFFPVIGNYYETTAAGKQLVEEESLFVIDMNGKKNLREFLVSEGIRYNQDSILFKPAGSNPVLIGTNDTAGWIQKGEVVALGKEAFNQPAEVYSRLHGNKTFNFKSAQVDDKMFDDAIKKEAMSKLVRRPMPDKIYP